MPCPYFKAVPDPNKKLPGYCRGYGEDKLRVPSVNELKIYCHADPSGCGVYIYRQKEEEAKQCQS